MKIAKMFRNVIFFSIIGNEAMHNKINWYINHMLMWNVSFCSVSSCSFNVTPNHYLCVFVHMCLILYILCIIMLFYAIHTFVCQRHFPFSLVVVFTHSIPLPRPWIGNVTVILPAVGMEYLTEISRNLYFVSYLSPNIMVYKPYNVE